MITFQPRVRLSFRPLRSMDGHPAPANVSSAEEEEDSSEEESSSEIEETSKVIAPSKACVSGCAL